GRRYLQGMSEGEIMAFVGYRPDWQPQLEFPEPPPEDFLDLIRHCLATSRDDRVASAPAGAARLEACSAPAPHPAVRAIVRSDPHVVPATGWIRSGVPGGATEGALAAVTAEPQLSTALGSEPRDESRAQWVSLIQTLRESVENQAGDFERLLKELIELDIPR